MYTAAPAIAFEPSIATPHTNSPTWLIVENASRRLRWRWTKHIHAPSSAVITPAATRIARSASTCGPSTPANITQYRRATAYTPSSTITPENRTHTGVGATAWASASQKCNGTIAALVRNPVNSRLIATTTSGSARWPSSAAPIWAMLSAPVRAYSIPRAMNIT